LAGQLIQYVDDSDKTKVRSIEKTNGTAICQNIMRSGKHYVSFQVNDDDPSENLGIFCGIMRPTTKEVTCLTKCSPTGDDLSSFSLKEYETLYQNNNIDCCLMSTSIGIGMLRRRWKQWKDSELLAMNDEEQREQAEMQNRICPFGWEGVEETEESSFKIGMVLDLDKGTLDVYKNDRRLGTMRSGLVGEYCWVVSLLSISGEISVTIGR